VAVGQPSAHRNRPPLVADVPARTLGSFFGGAPRGLLPLALGLLACLSPSLDALFVARAGRLRVVLQRVILRLEGRHLLLVVREGRRRFFGCFLRGDERVLRLRLLLFAHHLGRLGLLLERFGGVAQALGLLVGVGVVLGDPT